VLNSVLQCATLLRVSVPRTSLRVMNVYVCVYVCVCLHGMYALQCVVQRVAAYSSELQCVQVCSFFFSLAWKTHANHWTKRMVNTRLCGAVCCSVLQCVAVCCSLLQCVSVRHVCLLTSHIPQSCVLQLRRCVTKQRTTRRCNKHARTTAPTRTRGRH